MEDKLATISYAIDDFLAEIIEVTDIDPLSVTAIVLARLVLVNDEVGTGAQFRKLLNDASTIHPAKQTIQ